MGFAIRSLVFSLNRLLLATEKSADAIGDLSKRLRSLGIGIQGLAEALVLMGISFDSEQGRAFSMQIAETLYFTALDQSADLISLFGSYESFNGSPISQGIFQFDMWGTSVGSSRHDWNALRKKVVKGVANSTVVAYSSDDGTCNISGCSSSYAPLFR
jgi:ribonucleoside-diphosphate reductase alpha chain